MTKIEPLLNREKPDIKENSTLLTGMSGQKGAVYLGGQFPGLWLIWGKHHALILHPLN